VAADADRADDGDIVAISRPNVSRADVEAALEQLEPVRHVHSRDGRLFRLSVFPVLSCFFSSNSARCLAVITTSRASPLGADIGPGIVASSL
jgi:hypothetical protein